MTLKKSASVENDAFKSAKWDEVARGHDTRARGGKT